MPKPRFNRGPAPGAKRTPFVSACADGPTQSEYQRYAAEAQRNFADSYTRMFVSEVTTSASRNPESPGQHPRRQWWAMPSQIVGTAVASAGPWRRS